MCSRSDLELPKSWTHPSLEAFWFSNHLNWLLLVQKFISTPNLVPYLILPWPSHLAQSLTGYSGFIHLLVSPTSNTLTSRTSCSLNFEYIPDVHLTISNVIKLFSPSLSTRDVWLILYLLHSLFSLNGNVCCVQRWENISGYNKGKKKLKQDGYL